MQAWRLTTDWNNVVRSDQKAQLDEMLSTCERPEFPGGILPWPRPGKKTVYYGVAADHAQWRRLQPLLLAFAGPTLTTFTGQPIAPNPKYGPEKVLVESGFTSVARLVPADDVAAQNAVLKALSDLCRLAMTKSPIGQQAPESTSRLLGRLDGALADRDREASLALLQKLREGRRVDALNLRFLEIQIAATFQDWILIRSLPDLEYIVAGNRPGAVTNAIIEALYETDVRDAERVGDAAAAVENIAPLLVNLLVDPRPVLSAGAARLAQLFDGRKSALSAMIVAPPIVSAPVQVPGTDRLISAIVRATSSDSLQALREAVEAVDGADKVDRATVLEKPLIARLWHSLQIRSGRLAPPSNWIDWLRLIETPSYDQAMQVAREAASEWRVEEQIGTASEIAELASALESVSDGFATERLSQAIPVMVLWLRNDAEFPRRSCLPIYDALWTLLALGVHRGQSGLESSSTLFRALIEIGLTPERYRRLLQDALDMAGGVGRRTAYWLMDLVEATADLGASDDGARENFWASAIGRLSHVSPQLSVIQRAAYQKLAATLNVHFEAPPNVTSSSPGPSELPVRNIAIYTLTESAARQASNVLTESFPGINVKLYHDHGGSQMLKSAAEMADLFVMVTWSATHAATNFIRQHRPPDKPLLYASGRGATSICRAIDEYIISLA